MSGLKLAARFGFYPHKLGFCGLQEKSVGKILSAYLSGEKIPEQKIRKILKTFKGAFPYYKLIAENNGIKNPFDERVVAAYWLGNKLLEKVPIDSLRKMIVKDFAGPGLLSRKTAKEKANGIPSNSKAHHSFHVLIMGPVSGRITLKGELLDLCRVGWGKIIEYKKGEAKNTDKVVIKYQRLGRKKERYFLKKPVHKVVFWEKKFIPNIKIGDNVAAHWNYVAQILSPKDLSYLKKYTKITINTLNKLKTK